MLITVQESTLIVSLGSQQKCSWHCVTSFHISDREVTVTKVPAYVDTDDELGGWELESGCV